MDSEGVVLVIGAAGGVGTALCRRLAKRGVSMALAGRDANRLETLKRELSGADARVIELDARDFDAVEQAASELHESAGPLTGMVNLAGSIILKPAHLTTREEFDETIGLNLATSFAVVRAAGKVMARHGGSVVLMSTAAARTGLANHDAIAAAKGGVIGLTQSSAATYAMRGIRVNCVAPGLVDTPLAEKITGNEASRKASEAMHALGRIGEPTDVAPMIDLLLSDEGSWITGQTIGVDGGLAGVRPRGG